MIALLLLVLSCFLCEAQPKRIVSTAPSITETLFDLGLGGQVVGVTEYCRHPAEARKKPIIGSFIQPDVERILAQKPDLVITVKNPIQLTERLRRLGLRVVEVNPESVAGIIDSIQVIGRATGKSAESERLVNSIKTQLEAVKKSVAQRVRPSVLFVVSRVPGTLQGMMGAGTGTFVDEMLSIAGGANALAKIPQQYPTLSLEQVFAADPAVILDMGNYAHAEGRPGESQAQVAALWGQYPQLKAVKQRNVRIVADDVIVRPGPRLAEGAAVLRDLIHGSGTAR